MIERKYAYITKYALTKEIGIIKALIVKHDTVGKSMCVVWPKGLNKENSFYGKDFHLTEHDARLHAEKMRNSKIESLKKQITSLENLGITVKEAE